MIWLLVALTVSVLINLIVLLEAATRDDKVFCHASEYVKHMQTMTEKSYIHNVNVGNAERIANAVVMRMIYNPDEIDFRVATSVVLAEIERIQQPGRSKDDELQHIQEKCRG